VSTLFVWSNETEWFLKCTIPRWKKFLFVWSLILRFWKTVLLCCHVTGLSFLRKSSEQRCGQVKIACKIISVPLVWTCKLKFEPAQPLTIQSYTTLFAVAASETLRRMGSNTRGSYLWCFILLVVSSLLLFLAGVDATTTTIYANSGSNCTAPDGSAAHPYCSLPTAFAAVQSASQQGTYSQIILNLFGSWSGSGKTTGQASITVSNSVSLSIVGEAVITYFQPITLLSWLPRKY